MNKNHVSPTRSTSHSHSDSGSAYSSGGQRTPPSAASTRTFDRSDAESVSTTISHDSRSSNKENNLPPKEYDDEVVVRKKPEYTRVSNTLFLIFIKNVMNIMYRLSHKD